MILDEVIERYTSNAEYERTHGSLHGCLEFRQLVKWLKDYKRLLEQEPCEDAISREATLKPYKGLNDEDTISVWLIKKNIEQQPSVKPQKSRTELKFCDRNICQKNEYNGIGCDECEVTKSQEPCEDAVSRKALISHIENQSREWGEDYDVQQILGDIEDMPSVKPQEPSITWVTGADGAKIAFWDVPVWKVTKICEILGDPQGGASE